MSIAHFQSLQQMIECLEQFGYKDITDEVKRDYSPYLYLCTLERPIHEREQGPIYITLVDQLHLLIEQADSSLLYKQVWFCEQCRESSSVNYRKGASPTEVIESMGRQHRELSPHCARGARDLHFVPARITSRADLDRTPFPDWAKVALASLMFG